MVTAVIAGITAISAGIFLLVKNWNTVRDALVKGAKVIFSVWSRVLFFPILQFVKGIGFLGKMIGKALGIKSLEKEFGSLMQTMDDFDNRLAKIGRDAPKPFKILENSVQRTRVKFGGLTPSQEPPLVEPGSQRFLRESILNFGSPGQAKKLTSLEPQAAGTPFSVTNFSKLGQNAVVKFKHREDADNPFSIPESVSKTFSQDTKIIEHVVKLVVPGAGQDTVINLTPGSQAPPVEVNLLGAN